MELLGTEINISRHIIKEWKQVYNCFWKSGKQRDVEIQNTFALYKNYIIC